MPTRLFVRRALPWPVFGLLIAMGTLDGGHPAMAADHAVPSHPAETGQSADTPAIGGAFEFAVPLLERDQPAPSYGPDAGEGAADSVADVDEAMEMDHSAHQMPAGSPDAMEGMDHSQMPGMTHAPAEGSQQ